MESEIKLDEYSTQSRTSTSSALLNSFPRFQGFHCAAVCMLRRSCREMSSTTSSPYQEAWNRVSIIYCLLSLTGSLAFTLLVRRWMDSQTLSYLQYFNTANTFKTFNILNFYVGSSILLEFLAYHPNATGILWFL